MVFYSEAGNVPGFGEGNHHEFITSAFSEWHGIARFSRAHPSCLCRCSCSDFEVLPSFSWSHLTWRNQAVFAAFDSRQTSLYVHHQPSRLCLAISVSFYLESTRYLHWNSPAQTTRTLTWIAVARRSGKYHLRLCESPSSHYLDDDLCNGLTRLWAMPTQSQWCR